MSLENELKKNTEATIRLCDLMERFKPNAAPAPEADAPVKDKETTSAKKEEPKPETKKLPKVKLADLQAVAKNIIQNGGDELKARAKKAITDIGGEGAKISGLPKHPEAETVMPEVLEALKEIEKEIADEEM